MRRIRRLTLILAILAAAGLALIGYMYSVALRDPVVRRADVVVGDWPAGEPARTVLLVSDTHVAGPDMPPERLARIVARLNLLHPDLIVLTGDYVSEKSLATRQYSPRAAVAPLAGLRARLGLVAVLGNHDHYTEVLAAEFRRAFAATPITLLYNEAVRRGPFVIGGVDDWGNGRPDLGGVEKAMTALGRGPRLFLSHNPDVAPALRIPTDAVMAGHTHCGQIDLPIFGPVATMSRFGNRFACGNIIDHNRQVFVAAGLGTSLLPLRLGAVPDVWLVRFGPQR